MRLSELSGKILYLDQTPRGVCLGVGVSCKNFSVKYLLCTGGDARSSLHPHADFALPVAALSSVTQNGLILSRLRPALPKNCAKLFLGRPVYSDGGLFLGNVQDVEFDRFIATKLFTDRKTLYPFAAVAAVADAVLLRKLPPYPLGQRIPAPAFSKKQPIVTKSVLRAAIEKNTLIKLTLSLPPFSLKPNTSQTSSISPQARR